MKRNAVFFLTIAVILLSGCTHSISETVGSSDASALFSSSIKSSPNESIETSTLNSSDSEKNSEIICEPFRGLPKDDKPISTVNCKDFRPSLLCYGDGNTFFMWNGTVYKHNGKTTEALFAKNAYDLNYYDGMLYFIENDCYDIRSVDEVHIEGLLYRYDLNKGALETLTNQPVSLPVIDGGEMFYTDYAVVGDSEPTGIYDIEF